MISERVFYAGLALLFAGAVAAPVGAMLADIGLTGTLWAWVAVLVFDLLLAFVAVMLAEYAAGSSKHEDINARVEIAALAFGTISPLGSHALWVLLQSGDAHLDVSDASLVGALMTAMFAEDAVSAYFSLLAFWALLSTLLAFATAYDTRTRRTDGGGWAYFASLLLLIAASLFLVPWVSATAVPRQELFDIALRQASVVLLLWLLYALVINRVRIAAVTIRAASAGVNVVRQIAVGIAAVLLIAAIAFGLLWVALLFAGVAGRLTTLARVLADTLLLLTLAAAVIASVIVGAKWIVRIIQSTQINLPKLPLWALISIVVILAAIPLIMRSEPTTNVREAESNQPAGVVSFQVESIACADLRWEYGESDQVTAPVESCGAYSQADFIVAIGSATPRGGPVTEHSRALERGSALARVIATETTTTQRNVRVFVLNRGIETTPPVDGNRDAPRLALIVGTVTPPGASVDDTAVARDLAAYLRENPGGSRYSLCDLHAFTDGSPGPPTRLDCDTP